MVPAKLESIVILGLLLVPTAISIATQPTDWVTAVTETTEHPIPAIWPLISELQNHDPIEISCDEDFVLQGWPGNGTWTNPYRIDDLNITTSDGPAVLIENVSSPFVISGCVMRASEDVDNLIYWDWVSNGSIRLCTLFGSFRCLSGWYCDSILVENSTFVEGDVGVFLEGCTNASFRWNVVSTGEGFFLDRACESEVVDNEFIGCEQLGIYAGLMDGSVIRDNSFSLCGQGIELCTGGNGLVVEHNLFTNITSSAVGIRTGLDVYQRPAAPPSALTTVRNNSIYFCGSGLYGAWGGATVFANNTVHGCGIGAGIDQIAGVWIANNTITDTELIGIEVGYAHWNRIFGNLVSGSGETNAMDAGGDNLWDNGVSLGNKWDDHDGYGVYHVPGTAGSVDRWPERTGPPFISVQNETEIIAGTAGNVLAWTVYDSQPSEYQLFRNGSLIDSGAWDGLNITTPLDGLEVGMYNYSLMVTNLGNESSQAWSLVAVRESLTGLTVAAVALAAACVVIVGLVLRTRKLTT